MMKDITVRKIFGAVDAGPGGSTPGEGGEDLKLKAKTLAERWLKTDEGPGDPSRYDIHKIEILGMENRVADVRIQFSVSFVWGEECPNQPGTYLARWRPDGVIVCAKPTEYSGNPTGETGRVDLAIRMPVDTGALRHRWNADYDQMSPSNYRVTSEGSPGKNKFGGGMTRK